MIVVRGVNLFPTQIEEHLLRSPVLTGHYVIELTREGRRDDVTIRVEPRAEVGDAEVLRAEAEALVGRIKGTIGLVTRVVVEASGTIERSAGKAKRVLDRRGVQ
jgi:phenylacetate-CoA ligase